jgi:alpha-mannosidase
VRTIHESHLGRGRSRIVMRTCLHAGLDLLEIRLRIHWQERRRRLKLALPTRLAGCAFTGEIPGGVAGRPADGEEHVHGRWCLVAGGLEGRPAALGVAHTGCHGFDLLAGELRLSVLRSAACCHERGQPLEEFPEPDFMDLGGHEVRLLLLAGDPEEVRERLPGLADRLSAPPRLYAHLPRGRFHPPGDPLPRPLEAGEVAGLLALPAPGVRLLACKRSADGRALVLRLQEAAGRRRRAEVRLAGAGPAIPLDLGPLEIRTLRVEKDGGWRRAGMVDED